MTRGGDDREKTEVGAAAVAAAATVKIELLEKKWMFSQGKRALFSRTDISVESLVIWGLLRCLCMCVMEKTAPAQTAHIPTMPRKVNRAREGKSYVRRGPFVESTFETEKFPSAPMAGTQGPRSYEKWASKGTWSMLRHRQEWQRKGEGTVVCFKNSSFCFYHSPFFLCAVARPLLRKGSFKRSFEFTHYKDGRGDNDGREQRALRVR